MMLTPARIAAEALRLLPRKSISRAIGAAAGVPAPSPFVGRAIDTFIRAYDIDMSQAEVPEGGFRTFDEFFTRRLVPGARPSDPDPRAVVSPADGKIEDLGPVTAESTVMVKGKPYRIGELLGDESDAAPFLGGNYFIIYLSPRDYHRVHTPVSGRVESSHYVGGTLYPVNAIGTEHVPSLFARNERVVTMQRNEALGRVATIMVAAIGVGHIEMSYDDIHTNTGGTPGRRDYGDEGMTLARGDELGIFHLGSTAIVVLPKGHEIEFTVNPGASVRVGQRIAIDRSGR